MKSLLEGSTLQLLLLYAVTSCCVAVHGLSSAGPQRNYLVTGANKGQGWALCQRILEEHKDAHVFLCCRNPKAAQTLPARVSVVQLDVCHASSVQAARETVVKELNGQMLDGLVSNAGILWGYSMEELMEVNCIGVKRLLDAFLPLVKGTIIVVSTGLSPLMLSYSNHTETLLQARSWETDIFPLLQRCLETPQTPLGYKRIGFAGGPFAETVPEFHHYGLSKMFTDSYMLLLSKQHPNLTIVSVDPGLVYTDLILSMPKYKSQTLAETGAKSPREGVQAHLDILFGQQKGDDNDIVSGHFYAVDKAGRLQHGCIDKRPDV